jgi:hypothetical protein
MPPFEIVHHNRPYQDKAQRWQPHQSLQQSRRAWEKGLLGEMSEAERDRWLSTVSSHSIRVGVAQDNFAAGEGLPAIMQAYRWRDARTVLRYGSKLAAKSGASARLAKRFADQ